MKKHYQLLFLFLAVVFNTFAQTEKTIQSTYERYFDFRNEALFLHFNKSTYLVGEEIWFQAYLLDRKKMQTSNEATNIFVGIYNEEGIQLKKKLFHIQNGITTGNLKIDKKFPSGNYFVKASVHNNNNSLFNIDYIEKIVIIGAATVTNTKKEKVAESFDIQFLPEGGHIVENTKNRIAFKAINAKGKGVKCSGVIRDKTNTTVAEFSSNHLGIGSFFLNASANETYSAQIKIAQNSVLNIPLPKVQQRGFNIIVDNVQKDSIHIDIRTNKATLATMTSDKLTLLIHKDGASKAIPLNVKDTITSQVISKSELFNGVNTITLFKGKEPIVERMFFNEYFMRKMAFIIKKAATSKDSVTLDLFLIKNKKNTGDAIVSISVLPESTKSYDPAHNSFSSCYLKPYLKGFIENPSHYFRNNTINTRKNLDMLLITQGWSKYDWTTIFNNNSNKKPIFTNGITVSGTVNYPTKNVEGIYIQQGDYKSAFYVPINAKRQFSHTHFFPKDGEDIKIAYANSKKEFFKPKLYLKYNISSEEDAVENPLVIAETNRKKEPIRTIKAFNISDDTETLDAVILEGKKKEKRKHPDPLLLDLKDFEVDLDLTYRFPKVIDLIRHNGYTVRIDRVRASQLRITTRKPMTAVKSREPYIFIDDIQLENYDFILDLSMADVKKLTISRNGYGYGLIDASAGVIKIYLRDTPLTKDKASEDFMITRVPLGFSEAKTYYAPRYENLSSKNFNYYGVIDWKTNVRISRSGAHQIKIPNTGTEEITLFIEGISEDGGLISQRRTISVYE